MGLKRRWKKHIYDWKNGSHQSKLYNAFSKYGIENFFIQQIDKALSEEEMYAKEIFWIKFLDTNKNGYNILTGGFAGGVVSQEDKDIYGKNMSKVLQGRRLRSDQFSSKYIGVHAHRDSWSCCLKVNKKKYSKIFDKEIEAAIAYDKLVNYFYGPNGKTNFKTNYSSEELDSFFNEFLIKKHPRRKYPGKYLNVIKDNAHNTWRAIYRKNKKTIKTLYRKTEEEAYLALQEFINEYEKSAEINRRSSE